MDEQMQQQIVQLVQAAMQGDQQAQQQVEQIMQAAQQGDPQAQQIAQLIQQIIEQMQGQAQMARAGAKLERQFRYIQYLRGKCPEGYEMAYFKNGGKAGCRKCQQKENGGDVMQARKGNVVSEFRCGRKMKKKASGGNVDKAKCGKKVRKGQEGFNTNWNETQQKFISPQPFIPLNLTTSLGSGLGRNISGTK